MLGSRRLEGICPLARLVGGWRVEEECEKRMEEVQIVSYCSRYCTQLRKEGKGRTRWTVFCRKNGEMVVCGGGKTPMVRSVHPTPSFFCSLEKMFVIVV